MGTNNVAQLGAEVMFEVVISKRCFRSSKTRGKPERCLGFDPQHALRQGAAIGTPQGCETLPIDAVSWCQPTDVPAKARYCNGSCLEIDGDHWGCECIAAAIFSKNLCCAYNV
jgi:hypothetical protein